MITFTRNETLQLKKIIVFLFILFACLSFSKKELNSSLLFGSGLFHVDIDRMECLTPSENSLVLAGRERICLSQKMSLDVNKWDIDRKKTVFKIKVKNCDVSISGEVNSKLCEKYKEIENLGGRYDRESRTFSFPEGSNLHIRNMAKDLLSYLLIDKKTFVGVGGVAIAIDDDLYVKKLDPNKTDVDTELKLSIDKEKIKFSEKKYYNKKVLSEGQGIILIKRIGIPSINDVDQKRLTKHVDLNLEMDVLGMKTKRFEARLAKWSFSKIKKAIDSKTLVVNPGQLEAIIEAQIFLFPKTKIYFENVVVQKSIRPSIKKAIQNALL